MGKTANRPFEPTFRVQVHLPRNQLTVLRVSPRIKISELKSMVCKEKGLDTSRYQLVRPSGPTQPLAGDMTLAEYGSTEITLLSNSSIESHICNSNSHIIPYSKRTEDTKRKTGILRLLTEDANNKVNHITNCNSSFQVDGGQNRNNNKSEEAQVHQNRYKPKKRRPAPPPPPPILPEAPSHSRQSSSDSSGYHEATSSFLHEEHSGEEKASSDSSGVSSLDAKDPTIQPSPPPPIPNSKKKKAPAPPPPSKQKEKPHHRPAPACPPTKNDKNSSQEELPAIKDSSTYKVTNFSSGDNGKKPKEMAVQIALSEYREDVLAQKNCSIPSRENSKKDPVVLLQQQTTVEKTPQESLPSSSKKIPTAEFTISTYTATVRNPIIRDKPVIPKDNLVEKDYLTRENNGVEDTILSSKDHTISVDHVIPRDPVLKQISDDEKKVDVVAAVPRLWESEGQPPMTVAAKAPLAASTSTDAVKEKEIKREARLTTAAAENKGNSGSSVAVSPGTNYSCRTPEEKTDKGEVVSTRVALVALNARIEQDVTQQEIASSIQAAFHSVDYAPQQPSLLAIKQRNTTEDSIVPPLNTPWGRSESHTTATTTTLRVPLNSDPGDRNCEKSSPVESPRKTSEKEALVIDDDYPVPKKPISTGCAVNLKRSSSLLNLTPRNASTLANSKTRVRQLQRSLSDLTTDVKDDFEAEQERLQREYLKLQRQFLLWQQQLMNNHAMLREECIVPQYQARTLRQSHSLPEGEDTFDARAQPSVPPLVSRSLSYEPTKDRCSTLPRSAINITSLEFGSIPIGNGTSTLRSSKTKNYFKPPQIRASTKSRQRLPPEIKREGDVDITDDAKMLTTILPSFETLKLITENHDEDSTTLLGISSRLKDTTRANTTPTEGVRKVPVVHLSATFPKLNNNNNNNSRLSNGAAADKSGADRDLKYVNGDTGQSKLRVSDCSIAAAKAEQSQPPPPPPMPVVNGGVSKCSVVVHKNSIKSTGHRNGVVGKRAFTPSVDPREQLMLEIRKFGGRTALRKISLAS